MPCSSVMRLRRRTRSVVGIDISERAVRWVELKLRRGRIIVGSVGSRRFSQASAEVLDTTFDEEIGEAIAEILATDIEPGASVAVSLDLARVDISLCHLGASLGDDEIDFHARRMTPGRMTSVGLQPSSAEWPVDYRVIGCCPFEPGLLDVLVVTSLDSFVRRLPRLVRDAGRRLDIVDVDALIVARSIADAVHPAIVLCRGSTTEGFLVDPTRHGIPAIPCRLLDRCASVGASAHGGRDRSSPHGARVLELEPAFVEERAVISLDSGSIGKRMEALCGIDAVPLQADIALLLALGRLEEGRLS